MTMNGSAVAGPFQLQPVNGRFSCVVSRKAL